MLTYIYIICGGIMLFTIVITIVICQWAYFIPRKKIKKINREIDMEIYKNYLKYIARGKKIKLSIDRKKYRGNIDYLIGLMQTRENLKNNLPVDEKIDEKYLEAMLRQNMESLLQQSMQTLVITDRDSKILYATYYKKDNFKTKNYEESLKNKDILVKNIEARFNNESEYQTV